MKESRQWHFDNVLFPTPTELGSKLDSAESFSRKDADFSGSASVAASCPASRVNSLTVWYPRCSPCPATPAPSALPTFRKPPSLPQLWLPDAVSVVGNKIIRSGSTQQKPGKWGIILGRLCKSQAPWNSPAEFFVETLWPPLVVRVTGYKNNRQRLPSLPLSKPSFLPAKIVWL